MEALQKKSEYMQLMANDLESKVSALALECENLHKAVSGAPFNPTKNCKWQPWAVLNFAALLW
jgi:hypothetical protein